MCNPIVIPIIALAAQAASTLTGAKAQKEAAEYNAQVAEGNAAQQEILANDAINRGNADAASVRDEAKKIQASQAAALAANGLDLSSGNSLSLLGDSAGQGELDAQTTFTNALREAYGHKQQAANYLTNAKMQRDTGKKQYWTTLLTGIPQMYGSYQSMNANGASDSNKTGSTPKNQSTNLPSRRGR